MHTGEATPPNLPGLCSPTVAQRCRKSTTRNHWAEISDLELPLVDDWSDSFISSVIRVCSGHLHGGANHGLPSEPPKMW